MISLGCMDEAVQSFDMYADEGWTVLSTSGRCEVPLRIYLFHDVRLAPGAALAGAEAAAVDFAATLAA